jgi:excisionase family DNA binding protein
MSTEIEDHVAAAQAEHAAQADPAHPSVAPLLDAKGAAALLNVPPTWVLAEARADRIPHVRLGRYVRFDAAELQRWWQARRQGPWRPRATLPDRARSDERSATRGRRAA